MQGCTCTPINDIPCCCPPCNVQSGKSLVLNGVLPAVLRRHPFFGEGGVGEMACCLLDFAQITDYGTATYKERLRNLYRALLGFAGSSAPPLPSYLAKEMSRPGGADSTPLLKNATMQFLWSLERPVMYTVDEVQSWFILPDSGKALADQARGFFKILLMGMPHNAGVAITGSSMCTVWSNVAAMPPNGLSLALHNRGLALPAQSSEGSAVAWTFLKEHEHDKIKIIAEMRKDFGYVLKELGQSEHTLLFNLAAEDGVRVPMTGGLWLMLRSLLAPSPNQGPDYRMLASPYHRVLIKLLVTKNGDLQPLSLLTDSLPPIVALETMVALLRFGNAVITAWDDDQFASDTWLRTRLQSLVKKRTKGEDWDAMPLWKQVALYHCLLRNAIAHEDDAAVDEDEEMVVIESMQRSAGAAARTLSDLVFDYPFADPYSVAVLFSRRTTSG
ncbi:hypothetical protein GPECTOR_45g95 [Gonium pectorale]|uniref:Uncharacterized protein n=1 Tax=Gonium pectorale TaxID=33097 RepID=A0A150G9T4_GONPE|nr:hypothetical protein GPECTOR_45g95 [Gonium pectorale]|eukprot:KXZ46325.1 hypothetical protein GPECTOR_45g95 [Gonium pectorale]